MFEVREIGKNLVISGQCIETGKQHSVTVKAEEYKNWKAGELIQRAMPTTSADDREFLISSISPEGWNKLFGNINDAS